MQIKNSILRSSHSKKGSLAMLVEGTETSRFHRWCEMSLVKCRSLICAEKTVLMMAKVGRYLTSYTGEQLPIAI